MKKLRLIFILLFVFQNVMSQEKLGKPFITGAVNFTLGINEFYTPFDTDDGEALLEPNALFFRVGFGYEFKRRLSVSVNGGFDYHWKYAVSAFPTYGALKYNFTTKEDFKQFVEFRYGKMWTPSFKYPDGDYRGIGLGIEIAGEKRFNTVYRIDFHRKGIAGFKNDRIDSISFGIGFAFF
jgi:hypothetical protein